MLIGRSTIGTVARMYSWPGVPEPFVKAWEDMLIYNEQCLLTPIQRINYIYPTVSYHSFARDGLIDQMQGDWILMLDTDVVFEPDIVALMLQKMDTHKIDVLIGMYPYKGEVHAPVLYGYEPKQKKRFIIGDWDKNFDVIKCDGGGAGCLMIRKSVVDKIKSKGESLFAIKEPYSEDNSFFIRCRELKIPVFFSPNIKLKHLIYKGLDLDVDFPKEDRLVDKKQMIYGMK